MNVLTIVDKRDRTYKFYIEHNMHAVERKLNTMLNKGKTLINKIDHNWRQLLNRKFEIYRV